ncbi:hypothetical protein Bpfe_024645 [Biomphalaria pfeifferi]|uniref:Uncharacterized protein n=1 Tax=Biomphalaria pfeifferi TaxID=112525 RepID=A0AAD8B0X3_BIOPF|nr:hypothetical protein Bpfe_024645 [Biomphalaria pfeifferi]
MPTHARAQAHSFHLIIVISSGPGISVRRERNYIPSSVVPSPSSAIPMRPPLPQHPFWTSIYGHVMICQSNPGFGDKQ